LSWSQRNVPASPAATAASAAGRAWTAFGSADHRIRTGVIAASTTAADWTTANHSQARAECREYQSICSSQRRSATCSRSPNGRGSAIG
jgi:hypothetical protein